MRCSFVLFAFFALSAVVTYASPVVPTLDEYAAFGKRSADPVAYASPLIPPTPGLTHDYNTGNPLKRQVDLPGLGGRQELAQGHAPAKDYIVIEINKPIVHYFAAEAHQEAPGAAEESAETPA